MRVIYTYIYIKHVRRYSGFYCAEKIPFKPCKQEVSFTPLFFFYPFRRLWNTPVLHLINLDSFLNIIRPSFRRVSSFLFFFFLLIFRFLISEKDHVGNQKLFFFFLFYFWKKSWWENVVSIEVSFQITFLKEVLCTFERKNGRFLANLIGTYSVYVRVFQTENWFFSRVSCVVEKLFSKQIDLIWMEWISMRRKYVWGLCIIRVIY